MYEIPLLTPNDVELRVAQLKETNYGVYVTLLVYKDARVDMRLLDHVFGISNWQRDHKMIGDRMFCTISIFDSEKGEWISKTDVGDVGENATEATKTVCSDSFKRASFNFGIGRELYDAPDIHFKLNENEVITSNYGKPKTYAKFHVGTMVYDKENARFTEFTVLDEAGNIRFDISKNGRSNIPNITQPVNKPEPTPAVEESPTQSFRQSTSALNSAYPVCVECGSGIKSDKVAQFAMKRFNRLLCYNCQKKHGAQDGVA